MNKKRTVMQEMSHKKVIQHTENIQQDVKSKLILVIKYFDSKWVKPSNKKSQNNRDK